MLHGRRSCERRKRYSVFLRKKKHTAHTAETACERMVASGALHAHIENKDKERVERDVEHGADGDGEHRRKAEALRRNEGIQPQREHDEQRADAVDEEIAAPVRHRPRRRPEGADKRLAENQHRRREHDAEQHEQYRSRIEYAARLLLLPFPEEDARQRRAAQPHEVGEGAHDEGDGKNDAQPRDGEGAFLSGNGADVHPVHEII